jgi:3-hydroxybutyryl-CoA dehydrogenase
MTMASQKRFVTSSELILECIEEEMSSKKALFEQIAKHSPLSLIASNTSSLEIGSLSRFVPSPERFLGLHFFNPIAVSRFVEIVPHSGTTSDSITKAVDFVRKMNKEPVVTPDLPGFVINSSLFPMLNHAAIAFASSNLTAKKFDHFFRQSIGLNSGPLTTLDLIGLDTSLNILKSLHEREPGLHNPAAQTIVDLVGRGEVGRKSGKGFHNYSF